MNYEDKQCRTCLRLQSQEQATRINKNIAKMITDITALQVTPLDGFSQWVCTKCNKDIKRAFKFRNRCLNAAKVLYENKSDQSIDNIIEVKLEEALEEVYIKDELPLPDNDETDRSFQDDDDKKEESSKKSEKNRLKAIFECPFCHAPFSSMKVFKNHLPFTHPDKNEDANSLVKGRPPLGFISKIEVEDAEKRKGVSYEYKCACNDFKAPEYTALLEHFRIHFGDKPISCSFCDYKCAEFHQLRSHMQIHSLERPFNCPLCDYTCKNKRALRVHSAIHSEEKNYQCKLCPLGFKRASDLSAHKMKVHDKKKNHACQMCEKRFSTSTHLKKHMVVHTGERPHICHLCGQSFSQPENLKKHISVQHESPEEEKNYKCDLCDFTSKHAYSVARHISRHSGEKNYKCDQCDALFSDPYTLKLHNMKHAGETRFNCEMCDYRCLTLFELRSHEKVHSGERPFPCNVCSYSGKTQDALRRHLQTHSTDLKYACPNCPYRTNVSEILRRHIRRQCVIKKRGRSPSKALMQMPMTVTMEGTPINLLTLGDDPITDKDDLETFMNVA